MKTKKYNYIKTTLLLGIMAGVLVGCERDPSDVATIASPYSNNPEVFTDKFSAGLDYRAFENSLLTGFNVVTDVKYLGNTSMRFDIPNAGKADEAFVGGIYVDEKGRDLSGYDVLTFWAKGSQARSIDKIGFGNDFGDNKHLVEMTNVSLATYWKKYIIPIPDASKLTREKGLFLYAEGPDADGNGSTFWIDEVKYEKLGSVAQDKASIVKGEDVNQTTFIGVNYKVDGTTATFSLPNGETQEVSISPAYMQFTSSNPAVATVDDFGRVNSLSAGTTVITAKLNGVDATGSLTINCEGTIVGAPIPTIDASLVKSIYSNTYAAATLSNFDPQFGGSTTVISELTNSDGSFQMYSKNNFTGIIFNTPINASNLNTLHIDVYGTKAGASIGIQIRDLGPNGILETNVNNGQPQGDDKDYRFTATGIAKGQWKSFEINLGGNISNQKSNLGAIIITEGPDFILDNIYFH